MCDRMLPAFAVALDMPADFFAPFFADEAHANLRFLHYPPQDAGEDNLFGQAPHTDNSFMTALARTDVPGLAVRLPSGEWFPPPVIPGTFLINLGNIMRRWSNDRFLSTPHGVLNDSGTDRYSIAYFHSPNPDSVIECLPSCVSADNPARYPPARLSRPRARILPRQLFPPEGPPLRRGGAVGRRGRIGGEGCSISTASSRIAAPRCARIRPTRRRAKWSRAPVPTRLPSSPALGEPTRAGVDAAL